MHLDYTRIGKYGKIGAAVLLALLLYSVLFGSRINGRFGYLMFLGKSINLHLLMYLYIPFFGGILYFYRTKGKNGLFRVILWMLAPIILILRLPDLSLASALLMIMLLQGCYVMKKGWFNCGKKGMITMFSAVLALPVFMLLYFLFFGASYQRARIIAIFNMSNSNDINYQMNMARNILLESQFVGKSVEGVTEILPEVPSYFIITYIFSYYGVLVAGIVISFLVLFIIKNFKISISQKNQLGLVVGLGCSLVFAAQIIMYIMVNLTILPPTTVFLP